MSTQIHCWTTTALSTSASGNPILVGKGLGTSQHVAQPLAIPLTLRNWTIILTAAPGAGTSRTYNLQKNDVTTALTITIAGTATTGSILGTDVHFNAGDTLRMVIVDSGSPAASTFRATIEIEPDTDGLYIYGFSASSDTPTFLAPFSGAGNAWGLSSAFQRANLIGVDGAITAFRIRQRTAPGVGNSWILILYKNGVAQNGSGGTVDTRVTIADMNTTGSASFNLPVTAGDNITMERTLTGTPTGSTWMAGTLAFQPTTNTQYMFCTSMAGANASGATEFSRPHDGGDDTWDATEANRSYIGHSSVDLTFETIRAEVSGAPTAGKSWTFRLRKNGADTGLFVTIADSATSGTGSLLPPVTITAGDTWSLSVVAAGSPGAGTTTNRVSIGYGTTAFEEPTIETLAATNIRSNSATLRGRIDPNGTAMDGRFRWWICAESPPTYTDTDPQSVGAGSTPVVYTESLTGLLPSTTYCFQAIGSGFSPELEGAIKSFTTTGEAEFIDGTVSHPLTWIELYVDEGDLI